VHRNCAHPNAQSFAAIDSLQSSDPSAPQDLTQNQFTSNSGSNAQNPRFNYFSPKFAQMRNGPLARLSAFSFQSADNVSRETSNPAMRGLPHAPRPQGLMLDAIFNVKL
jgi:hypothetical protein